ncbi:MAG: glycosyltransferase family 2 protein [Myxococcales bacterium FL481]|nr:MAG: glycosyltransferase family 2 protein [Myxococcales bacterium FL481]
MPPRCRQVLAALLESVSSDIAGHRCLDLSANGLGGAWFDARGVAWSDASRLRPHDRFALVVCELASIDLGLEHLDVEGVLLVFVSTNEAAATWLTQRNIISRASVRSAEGNWFLCARRPVLTPTYEVSLVVPCQDDARYLAPLLLHLANDPGEVTWELVVVDRGSFDETGALLRSLQGDVRVIHRPRHTLQADALDVALHACAGELAVVVDPHLIPAPGWLPALTAAAAASPEALAFLGQSPAEDGERLLPLLAVRSAPYRARGGLDPTLATEHAVSDLLCRLGTPRLVPALTADLGQPIDAARTG